MIGKEKIVCGYFRSGESGNSKPFCVHIDETEKLNSELQKMKKAKLKHNVKSTEIKQLDHNHKKVTDKKGKLK